MIAPQLGGKTFGQVDKIAAQAAVTVDPDLAERTREHAERNRARVTLRRERSGAASLGGYDLPPAETLAAHAATCARAQLYKDSKAFPGVFMDQLRAMAYLDLINQVSAEARIAAGPPGVGLGAPGEGGFRGEPEPDDPGAPAPEASGGSDCPCTTCDGRCAPPDDAPDDAMAARGSGPETARMTAPRTTSPGTAGGPGGPGGMATAIAVIVAMVRVARVPGPAQADRPHHPPGRPPRPANTARREPRLRPPRPRAVPRPGRARRRQPPHHRLRHRHRPKRPRHRPRLPRDRPPQSKAPRRPRPAPDRAPRPPQPHHHRHPPHPAAPPTRATPPTRAAPPARAATPARPRTTDRLGPHPARRPRRPAPHDDPPARPRTSAPRRADPPWCRTWTITLPSGLQLRRPARARPHPRLRPPAGVARLRAQRRPPPPGPDPRSRVHAPDLLPPRKESPTSSTPSPTTKGGRTCACNAGARSRACHQVKQSPGWKVTQPKPGWHQWQTPSGRTYTQEPNRYPT